MLTEATRKSVIFSLKKLEVLIKNAEAQGFKRWWEENEIWHHYFNVVAHILVGEEATAANEKLRRSKAIPAESLECLNNKKYRGSKFMKANQLCSVEREQGATEKGRITKVYYPEQGETTRYEITLDNGKVTTLDRSKVTPKIWS